MPISKVRCSSCFSTRRAKTSANGIHDNGHVVLLLLLLLLLGPLRGSVGADELLPLVLDRHQLGIGKGEELGADDGADSLGWIDKVVGVAETGPGVRPSRPPRDRL
jgi:hypothetical protein